ncbi:MAG: hypothetical protein K8M05_01945 [Deltaproteobacteria bacterium]|nr:hypothetical protein [Kofleriaceae bacterium]
MSASSRQRILIVAAVGATGAALAWCASSPSSSSTRASVAPAREVAPPSVREAAASFTPALRRPLDVSRAEAIDRMIHAGRPAALRLRWSEVTGEGQLAELEGSKVALVVENVLETSLDVSLEVTIDGGAGDARIHRLPALAMPARDVQHLALDLAAYGVDLATMRVAGHVRVTARADTDGGDSTASSPSLYFHRAAGGAGPLLVYDERALHERFAAGDIHGRAQAPDEPGVVTARVVAVRTTTTDPATAEPLVHDPTGDHDHD